MNIFETLPIYVYNNYSGKLVHDEQINHFLFFKNELVPIKLHSIESLLKDDVLNFNEDYNSNTTLGKYQIYSRTFEYKKEGEIIVNTNYGFIDKNGNAFTPAIFSKISLFKNGMSHVQLDNYLKGVIDFHGNPIVKGKHLKFCSFAESEFHKVGLCFSNGKWGVINEFCYNIIPCIYDQILFSNPFRKTFSFNDAVFMRKNSEWYTAIIHEFSVVNVLNGLYEVEFKHYELGYSFIVLHYLNTGKSNTSQILLCNMGGEKIIDDIFDQIKVFSPKYVGILKNGKWSILYIDDKLRPTIIKSDLDDILYGNTLRNESIVEYVVLKYANKNCLLELNNEFCIEKYSIDDGEIYFDQKYVYETHKPITNSFFAIRKQTHTDLIDFDGNILSNKPLSNKYILLTSTCSEMTIGIKLCQESEKKGYIDFNGNILVEPQYYHIEPFNNGQAYVCSYNGIFIINKEGQIISSNYYTKKDDNFENDWKSQISDAFDGELDAYWNID